MARSRETKAPVGSKFKPAVCEYSLATYIFEQPVNTHIAFAPQEEVLGEEAEMTAAEDVPIDDEDDDVEHMPPGGNPYNSGRVIGLPRGRDVTHLLHYPKQVPNVEIARRMQAFRREAAEKQAAASGPAEAPKMPPPAFTPGSFVPRPNVASVKAHALEFGYHVRRRPWETGNVHAPLVITRDPKDNSARPIKTLWQSNAYIDSKIVRPGPLSFRLPWPDNNNIFRLDRAHEPPVFPLFYTEEGYVYLPKKILWRDDRAALLKYVEFWGWNWEPTRSPPREVAYKANLKAGIHALPRLGKAEHAPKPREDLGIDWAREFREEVKIRELLGLAGSAHFSRLVGFPAHSESGFLAECDEWERTGTERLDRVLGSTGRWSVYSVWKMFECLAKACAVMAWGSEYPDFPVEGWNQIIHLGLGQPSRELESRVGRV